MGWCKVLAAFLLHIIYRGVGYGKPMLCSRTDAGAGGVHRQRHAGELGVEGLGRCKVLAAFLLHIMYWAVMLGGSNSCAAGQAQALVASIDNDM
jgi:hypothetical protein